MRDKVTRLSTDHKFWRERKAEADLNRGSSAYQPNTLPLGQTLDVTVSFFLCVCFSVFLGELLQGSSDVHNRFFRNWCSRLFVLNSVMENVWRIFFLIYSHRAWERKEQGNCKTASRSSVSQSSGWICFHPFTWRRHSLCQWKCRQVPGHSTGKCCCIVFNLHETITQVLLQMFNQSSHGENINVAVAGVLLLASKLRSFTFSITIAWSELYLLVSVSVSITYFEGYCERSKWKLYFLCKLWLDWLQMFINTSYIVHFYSCLSQIFQPLHNYISACVLKYTWLNFF